MKNLVWNPREVLNRCWIVVLTGYSQDLIDTEKTASYISGYAMLKSLPRQFSASTRTEFWIPA